MGISYSAVKVEAPEAWNIGKDYYGYTDLFPACAYHYQIPGLRGIVVKALVPSLKDLPHLAGSRHMVGPQVFRITDYYKTADEMLVKIADLKKRPIDAQTAEMLRKFYETIGW